MSLLSSALLTYLEMLVKLIAIIKKNSTDLLLGTHMLWPTKPTTDACRRATGERKR